MNKPVVLCAGGDTRYIYTAKELCKLGKVYTYGIGGQPDEAIVLKSVDDMPQKADLITQSAITTHMPLMKTEIGYLQPGESAGIGVYMKGRLIRKFIRI